MNIDRMHTIVYPFTQMTGNTWVLNEDKYWVFRSLQMGLSSSPRIYTSFADAVEFVCVKYNIDIEYLNGIQQLRHCIDDFLRALPDKKNATSLYMHFLQYSKYWVFQLSGKNVQVNDNGQKSWDGFMTHSYRWYCYQMINDCYY